MSRDDFSIPGYDEWKTRAPEDEPGYYDDKEPPDDDDDDEGDDHWTCAFPGRCLMPSPLHTRDECYTVEDAEEYYRENEGLPNG